VYNGLNNGLLLEKSHVFVSALEAIFNEMRYISLRFTYLLIFSALTLSVELLEERPACNQPNRQ